MNDARTHPEAEGDAVNEPLQRALDRINEFTVGGDESQQLIAAKCRGLIRGYDARWRDAPWRALAVEQFVESGLYNVDTERSSRTFRMGGKIDVIAELDGRQYVFDHKTTSQDIADPNAPYWRQLVVEGQASHYMLLQWVNGVKAHGAVWDVVRKPQTRPKKITKAVSKVMIQQGTYCGIPVPRSKRLLEQEDFDLYEIRLAQDCTVERPEHYFQRRPIPRLDDELIEYARELWEHGQEIQHARRNDRHARNSGACMMYNSPCKFLGICSGHDSPDSDKWQRRQQVHPELEGYVDGDGRELLTNSRIRCFQTCRRKHYLQYELGLERLDEEEREALYFGNVWHAAQEEWWKCQMV